MFVVRRSDENPVLRPVYESAWEGFASFNWCPVDFDGKIHVVYRAMSLADPIREGPHNLSTIGYAVSKDGKHYSDRRVLVSPTEQWEKYGCEDPRVVRYGDTFYIFYTALSKYPFTPDGIRVAVAKTKDFKKIDEKHLVTPFSSKAMALFPEPINGKMTAILTVEPEQVPKKIAIAQFDKEEDMYDPEWWKRWYATINEQRIYPERTPNDQIEIGAPPIKTEYGWLLVYSMIENHFERGRNYQFVYGIEAVLLDLNDPRKIIGKTKGPFITPLEPYERAGAVNNVVFPTGVRMEGEMLQVFYGAADTTGCIAEVRLKDLVETLYPATAHERRFSRIGGPVLTPDMSHKWENRAVFNPAAIDLDGSVHILYRAMGEENTSVVGYARSEDAETITERLPEPIYMPRADFEQKRQAGNSGCEDPRITKIEDSLYLLYTAYDAVNAPRVAVASITEKDFLARNWNWTMPQLISPLGIDDKDACLLPKKVQGKYALVHRIASTVCAHYFDTLDFEKEKANTCVHIIGPRSGMWDSVKVGLAGPPIETDKGWLMLYHGISEVHNTYRVGAALLAKDDLTQVLGRTSDPFFEPEMVYEKEGIVGNVVFPCGSVVRGDTIYIYYGAADTVVGIAKISLATVLNALT
ncbi:MAG: hypothetical protein HYT30_01105 [Parcubacteria group bacterium]|nr:hypothetical protein [Parcubacteria group bacterium]